MSQLQPFAKENLRKSASFALAFALLCTAAAVAEPITGVVTNKTNSKPAAGDDVVLLKLSQGMQELARTKTDAKGRFTIEVPQDGLHMIRVTHDKANYFRPVQPGTQSVEVEVFSAAAKVDGVTQEADVMRIQSEPGNNSGLRIVEHYFVKNESSPQKTQFSDHPFELWLPKGAVVEGSAAMAPGGMAVQQPLVPMADDPNHYTMIFPLRPGETQFQVTYKLPYSGSLTLAPKPAQPTDTVAVMLPKSIKFLAGASSPYTPVTEETTAQTFVARNVKPGQPLDFTISGTGELPRDSQAGQQQPAQPTGQTATGTAPGGDAVTPSEASAQMRADTQPGKGLGNPLDSDGNLDPWAKYKWWIVGGLAVVLAVGAGLLFRNPGAPGHASSSPQPNGLPPVAPGGPLQVLKDELFAIETERLQGRLTEAEYVEQKAALEIVLKRTLARNGNV
ncbi:hypothetical protein SAMN05421770_103422 [Granulicella rosea]|uniref:Carboxypeptidase regulatory-like domain-containing protein n=1 Tax=Granulicella rosea TaxID=474952 RepID=A0A239J3N5_9BACT|nr:carboxypeptidase-like regulatory domain-containing protein [Granulicella rosea]SNT00415.1 hypothetical protein SAMN05421770_103422 [Granulicella rosea]